MATVLVIDDDVAIAEVMRVVLEDAGFQVTVAHDRREIPDARFSCIVSDLIDVSLYSYDDARDCILRLSDRCPNTPVIVATAHVEARIDAQRLGAMVLVKPFEVEELVSAVQRLTS